MDNIELYVCGPMPGIYCSILNEKHIYVHYIIQFFKVPDIHFWPLQSYILSLDPAFYILQPQII